MTDWLSTGGDRADDAKAVFSGVDLIMPGGKKVVKNLKKAVKQGTLFEEALQRSCGRVLDSILESVRH